MFSRIGGAGILTGISDLLRCGALPAGILKICDGSYTGPSLTPRGEYGRTLFWLGVYAGEAEGTVCIQELT
jgi:hypothetical protein